MLPAAFAFSLSWLNGGDLTLPRSDAARRDAAWLTPRGPFPHADVSRALASLYKCHRSMMGVNVNYL